MIAGMTDFGGKLREAREGRGISLRQIAATTKISVPALEALERNDVSRLPGGIFSRAIVRSYALEVGLEPEETVHEFLQRFQATPGVEPPAAAHPPAEGGDVDQQKQHAARVFLIAVMGMLLAGSLVAVLVYQMRPSDLSNPAAVADVTPIPPPPTYDAESAAASSAAPAADTSAPEKPVELRLELHPTAPCWVNVVVEDKIVLSRLLTAGERETVTTLGTAVLTVGDAAACTFSINGRPARPLGGAGQVRTARISPATIDEYLD